MLLSDFCCYCSGSVRRKELEERKKGRVGTLPIDRTETKRCMRILFIRKWNWQNKITGRFPSHSIETDCQTFNRFGDFKSLGKRERERGIQYHHITLGRFSDLSNIFPCLSFISRVVAFFSQSPFPSNSYAFLFSWNVLFSTNLVATR